MGESKVLLNEALAKKIDAEYRHYKLIPADGFSSDSSSA